MKPSTFNKSGFTLIESIVAILIFSISIALFYPILSSLQEEKQLIDFKQSISCAKSILQTKLYSVDVEMENSEACQSFTFEMDSTSENSAMCYSCSFPLLKTRDTLYACKFK